jgi:DNA-binding transcriptional regulator YdaS (Cro superfamily)
MNTSSTSERGLEALDKAIEITGGVTKLASIIGVDYQLIQQWRKKTQKDCTPAGVCVRIEQATNGEVTRADLRPGDWQQIWPEFKKKQAA